MSFRWVAFIAAVILSCGLRVGAGTARSHARRRIRARARENIRSWPASTPCERAHAPHSMRKASVHRCAGARAGERAALGQDSSFDSAETTLSLASVFERGGKREARAAAADAQLTLGAAGRAAPRGSAGRGCAALSRCGRGAVDGGSRRCRGRAAGGGPSARPRSACAQVRLRIPCASRRRRPWPAPRCSASDCRRRVARRRCGSRFSGEVARRISIARRAIP